MPEAIPPLYKRSPQDQNFLPIPPLKNYKPPKGFPIGPHNIGEGQMMDLIRRDSGNFSNWMEDYGGYHLDPAQGKFVHDGPEKPGAAQKISEWLSEGYINPGNALMKIAEPLLAVGKAGKESLPGFNEWATEPLDPAKALSDMASYEKTNPLGSALGFMGNVVAGKTARGFKQAENLGRVFGGAVDQMPRFEIADNMSRMRNLKKEINEAEQIGDIKKVNELLDIDNNLRHGVDLKEILKHDELYNQYPELGNTKVKFQYLEGVDQMPENMKGSYNPAENEIRLMGRLSKNQKSTLLHEVQHAIQEREGFAKGGDPFTMALNPERYSDELEALQKKLSAADLAQTGTHGDLAKRYQTGGLRPAELTLLQGLRKENPEIAAILEEIRNSQESLTQGDPYEAYRRLAGETESRNVQDRMNMTDAERQAKPFNTTFDVPVENQIKRMKFGPMSSVSDNPNFQKWFGDSKVVDEKGAPITVYHGTADNFTEFKKPKGNRGNAFDRDSQAGIFFSSDPDSADYFAFTKGLENKNRKAFEAPVGSNIMPTNLKMDNPLTHDFNGAAKDPDLILKLSKQAKKEGKDGLILKNVFDAPSAKAGDIYVAFDPKQIKSTHNRGTFDPLDPNILKSLTPVGGAIGAAKKKKHGSSQDFLSEYNRMKS